MDLGFEITFLSTIITDFHKVITFLTPGMFGKMYSFELYRGAAESNDLVILDKRGTMIFIYLKVFGGPFPTNPTPLEQEYINRVWISMNLPENVIAV
jgi:hypothetical protein